MKPGSIIIIFVVLGIAIFWGYTLLEPGTTMPGSPGGLLAPVEIQNYEGEDLSSFRDFRENSIKGPQKIQIENYQLLITGLVEKELSLPYSEILNTYPSYKKAVTLHCVEGWDATILWEGILVQDLLDDAGIKPSANTIIFYAEDGYSTSFPLPYIMEHPIIMAHRMNNLTLPIERGYPFQLVAEDKWGYKWIKWITKIELSDNQKYRGYWESRGYAQDADLNKGFFN